MKNGVDAYADCSSIASDLSGNGRSFVCRYLANSGRKRITRREAEVLNREGLTIVTVWEDGFPTRGSYFSFAKGVDDATSAYHDASVLGQPPRTPIYFTVDFDAGPDEVAGSVSDYFRGVAQGFTAIGSGESKYEIGVYGSGATCSWLVGQGMVTYSWLALSEGWRGREFPQWNIRQSAGGTIGAIEGRF